MIDTTITVEIGAKEFPTFQKAADHLLDVLEGAPDRAAKQITRELRQMLQRVAAEIRKTHGGPWNGDVVNPTDRLQRRSGEGLRSILESIRVKGGKLSTTQGSISTGTMTIHETGGVITARTSRYLTIPLPAACDSRGVPLMPRARDWPNTFVQRSRRGNLIIFQRRGREIVPLYLLKTSVTIKPRLRLEQTIMGELPFFQERLLDKIAEEIDR